MPNGHQPPYLLRMRVEGFRSLASVEVAFSPLTVLVGPNGAGKSNLLDVIRFLSDSARFDIGETLRLRGGFERVAFRAEPPTKQILIHVDTSVTRYSKPTVPDEYELILKKAPRSRSLGMPGVARTETLTFKRTGGRGRRITLTGERLVVDYDAAPRLRPATSQTPSQLTLNNDTLALATLPKLGDQQGGQEVAALAQLFESFRVVDIDVRAARQPSAVGRHSAPEPLRDDASNLAANLYSLFTTHPEDFDRLVRDAKRSVPGLTGIEFEAVGGSGPAVALVLVEQGLRDKTYLAEASFGTIRVLALLALFYDPNPPRLTCIEEIDHGLHPDALDVIVDCMRQATTKTQVIATTHSPSLVNRLRPNELIVCERRADGSSAIPAISADEVRKMEAELGADFGLGELWFSGALSRGRE